MTRVAVMGAGAWGTAFSLVLADAGCEVTLWARRPDVAEAVNGWHHNPDYLSDVRLPDAVTATSLAGAALEGAEVVVLAVPSQLLRGLLAGWTIGPDALVLSLAKGIEVGTGNRMSEVVADVAGVPPERIGVLSGPNLAREIAQRQPSASVVASTHEPTALALQRACHTPSFRAYTNTDVIGCELGGAAKNVIALAVGVAVGMGTGHNAQASVITRGLAETTRLGEALGADPHTFAGLAGLGDLVATCSSPLSRNRTFGEYLGRGHSIAEAIEHSQGVAEGVQTCVSLTALADAHGVEMPIASAVVEMIAGRATPAELETSLMSRSPKPER